MREYVAIDLETTGLNPYKDRIIEIGAVRMQDGREVERFSTLVDPMCEIPERITELTGIKTEMLVGAPSEEVALDAFLLFVGEAVLLGHNLTFDYSFLKVACAKRKLSFERRGIDTLTMAKKHLSDLPSRSLPALCEYYGIDNGSAHRALDDARSAALLYEQMRESYGEEKEEQLSYRLKKISPMTIAQKNYLNDLIKYHKIICNVPFEKMTKSEASRLIDKIILEHGRIEGRRPEKRGADRRSD